ncbi:hypothetical protein [Vibrio rumoiensis]|uniref:Lipoprotein n=1 Tax=Vibrio rumoiensis 1S-45 TaxID=1188252 RepID=A0A1E5E5U4_9VIBR|nr:hypothetical protein [Vibrio rumoiensis]OEF29386.1 hypothetical protein A1QC_03825 [Vibrio rumoiensis 1S-45]
MKKLTFQAILLSSVLFTLGCAHQDQKAFKDNAREAAQATKEAGRTIGHTTRDAARETGHFFRDIFKD